MWRSDRCKPPRKRKPKPRKSASSKPPKMICAKWCRPPNRRSPPPPSKPAANCRTHTADLAHRPGPQADQRRFQYRPGSGPQLRREAGGPPSAQRRRRRKGRPLAMASVVGTYARAFADVVMKQQQLDPGAHARWNCTPSKRCSRKVISCGACWKTLPFPETASAPCSTRSPRTWVRLAPGEKFCCGCDRSPTAAAVQRNPETGGTGTERPPGLRGSAGKQRPSAERSGKADAGSRDRED